MRTPERNDKHLFSSILSNDTNAFYDAIAAQFDRFHRDMQASMQREGAQLRQILRQYKVATILDASCGTGLQSVPLAKLGFSVTACDPSPAMLEKAQENAATLGVSDRIKFHQTEFRILDSTIEGQFDAVITKGDALTHLIENADLEKALANFAGLLNSGGLLVIGIRDYDFMLEDMIRFVPTQFHDDPAEQMMVYEIRDFEEADPPTVTFNTFVVTGIGDQYAASKHSVVHRALRRDEMEALLIQAGFTLQSVEMQGWENIYLCVKN